MPSAMSGSGLREYPRPTMGLKAMQPMEMMLRKPFQAVRSKQDIHAVANRCHLLRGFSGSVSLDSPFTCFLISQDFQDILDGPFSLQIYDIQQGSMYRKAGITGKSDCNDLASDNWQARHGTTAEDGTIAKSRTKAISQGKGLPHEDEEPKDRPLPHRRRYQLSC